MTLALAAFAAALAGFAALGLAMDRHYEDAFGRGREPGRARPWLRIAGSALLALALADCLRLQGAAMGWVLWLGVLTAGALSAVALASYAPRRLLGAGAACAALALLGLLA